MDKNEHRQLAKRRQAQINPPNRFERETRVDDFEHLEHDEDASNPLKVIPTEFIEDKSKSVVSENDSPDVGFRFSVNPYRGCEHGCSYCYARPWHEMLGYNAGLDFETKIVVKRSAPRLLREFLAKKGWRPEPIMLSGVTDCYQPAERKFKITRGLLEVFCETKHPVCLITKNSLILRDVDLLEKLASQNLTNVAISVTTLDADLARRMEPRTSPPEERIRAIKELSAAGVPVRVMVTPILPGWNDSEAPAILKAARDAETRAATYVMLRLSGAVKPVFLDWVEREFPNRRGLIESRVKAVRGGDWNDNRFRKRMRGEGEIADQFSAMFKVFAKRLGFENDLPPLDASHFRAPNLNGQLELF